MRVLEQAPQSRGWPNVLGFLDSSLHCKSFLAAYDSAGDPTDQFGGLQAARDLRTLLQQIETEGGHNALEFLLTDASLNYPYCKASLTQRLHDTPLSDETFPDHSGAFATLRRSPGLIAPVLRSRHTTVLFACLFTSATPETIDVAEARNTFRGIVDALGPGLQLYCQIESNHLDTWFQRLLLSCVDAPSVLVSTEREILAKTSNALEALARTGIADQDQEKLVVRNKKLDAALLELAVAARRHADGRTTPLQRRSFCLSDTSGFLMRLVIQAFQPASTATDGSVDPVFVICLMEASDVPEGVEKCLQDHFDLSQSEAHLARQLTLTGSMNTTIDALGITRNTAKTHLRRIYEKTGVNTQLQLAGLVHRLAQLF